MPPRYLNPLNMCKGTRLLIKYLRNNIIEAIILVGPTAGQLEHIPRIPMIPTDMTIRFKRLQFPVKVSFALTINKSQGPTLKFVGIDLSKGVECGFTGALRVGWAVSYVSTDECNQRSICTRGGILLEVYVTAILSKRSYKCKTCAAVAPAGSATGTTHACGGCLPDYYTWVGVLLDLGEHALAQTLDDIEYSVLAVVLLSTATLALEYRPTSAAHLTWLSSSYISPGLVGFSRHFDHPLATNHPSRKATPLGCDRALRVPRCGITSPAPRGIFQPLSYSLPSSASITLFRVISHPPFLAFLVAGGYFSKDPPMAPEDIKMVRNRTIGACWIGQSRNKKWPARFPALSPMDFYLWGTLEQQV
ncbi:hypothetical protein PR048_006122 [Dryococelus australis]|uniref:ATP-dependent DNA helicase n=1 Tax=Dryococelus australis TaxID=614101 RepID=A0ABQ9IA28_9NEOP|nr:hypothetical protein PR048_006122 [Dryococelus australis]